MPFHDRWHTFLNNHTNFVWYNKIGNLGFIGYSGATGFEETKPYFEEACAFMENEQPAPDVIFLLGHWNQENAGCAVDMETQDVHHAIVTMPGCSGGDRLKYIDGHEHCNLLENGKGYNHTDSSVDQDDEDAAKENWGFLIARHDSAEDFSRLNALLCTAMGWIFIPAYCFANS